MKYVYNDGGRSRYFKAKKVGDCVVRSIAIASGRDYKEVYDLAKDLSGDTPRNGVKMKYAKQLAANLGGKWVACCGIGTTQKTHLRDFELPDGKLVCRLSGHFTAVIDGVIEDTYDPSRGGNRLVYGYWVF